MLRETWRLTRAARRGRPDPDLSPVTDGPEGRWGTVVATSGRYLAGRIDLLTRERFKSVEVGRISPFVLAGVPDEAMRPLAEDDRATAAGRAQVRKDFAARLSEAGADYLVVDNSAALMRLREIDGRYYCVVPGEDSALTDRLRAGGSDEAGPLTFAPAKEGLDPGLEAAYDEFVRACLSVYDPARIILLRTHPARFWADPSGRIAVTDLRRRDARLLERLDAVFAERTGCQVSEAALVQVPTSSTWHSVDSPTRVAVEQDLVDLIVGAHPGGAAPVVRRRSAAHHLAERVAAGAPPDRAWLRRYFRRGPATTDDLLALAYLDQQRPGRFEPLVRACVRAALSHPDAVPVAATRRRFERSTAALRAWPWCGLRLPDDATWEPQVSVRCADVVVSFHADGSIRRRSTPALDAADDVDAVLTGRLALTPETLGGALSSWPLYLERGRRGLTAAPRVLVEDVDTLLASCSWLDWQQVLANERVVVTTRGARVIGSPGPTARTDLSFVFDPRTRIGTVGGGLMDQVTHVALFEELCAPHDLDLYLDDFRYSWTHSHNGFEASRLAPDLEARRITRLISPSLLERFRAETLTARLPWLFAQSRAWRDLGLHEAFVVTRDYFNARRLAEIGPDFPFLVYPHDADLADHVAHPPHPVTFFTTQHRIAIAARSAEPLRRSFSYGHLETAGLPVEVARTARTLKTSPHVAVHVRRGDYLNAHFDADGWFSRQEHYVEALRFVVEEELGTAALDLAVFSDDLPFVAAHREAYGLDQVTGTVRFIEGNRHYDSIYDSYLMSLCPVVVASVGFFAATTSLLAEPPSTLVRCKPGSVHVAWRREA